MPAGVLLNEQKAAPPLEKRLRWAGLLIALGLAVQLLTFIWIHPLAFMAFALIGCPLVLAGMLVCLYALVKWVHE
jgi:archaellum biogenesis protein FlaJ (TadC family)